MNSNWVTLTTNVMELAFGYKYAQVALVNTKGLDIIYRRERRSKRFLRRLR